MQTRAKNIPVEEIKEIVGEANVREASLEDVVEGVEPSFVVEPGSVEEMSGLMRLFSREGLAVAPRGGGTKMYLGDPPRELDVILSTARMNGVIEHVPGDQVVRVQAGIRLEDLQERLAGSDQMLAIDPPERGATIGGIVAANSSGPRRLRYGTVRDLIIGIRVVLSDGTVSKAGGKVVKNVAGYDLSKLFTGSLGTLGVIAEANFRLHPVREVAKTVLIEVDDPGAIEGAAQDLTHSPFSQFVLDALEMRWEGDKGILAVLFEGIEAGVEAQTATASQLVRSYGEVRVLEEDEGLWEDLRQRPWSEGGVGLKVNAPPADLGAVLESVLGAAGRRDVEARIAGHAGTGVTFVGLLGGGEDANAEITEELREIWRRRGGSVVLESGPVGLKRRVGTWGTGGRDDLGLMRRVKEKFDPRGTLNPGRFIGGI
jgi:glycolate oxidase FAD binding subunit